MTSELEENRESVNFGSACDARRRTKETGPEIGVIVGRVVREQLRAMGCERFDLGIRRAAGEMILREGQGALQIEQAIKWLRHENARGAHILHPARGHPRAESH